MVSVEMVRGIEEGARRDGGGSVEVEIRGRVDYGVERVGGGAEG